MTRTRDIGTRLGGGHNPVAAGDFHLLLIGIDKYEHWAPLRTARRDAEAVRDVLMERYGFAKENITELFDAKTRARDIDRTLRAYTGGGKKLGEDDSLLIYYAGHGHLDDLTGEGAWIPSDAEKDNAAAWIDNAKIKSYMAKIPARHILLVSDSCFAGDFFRGDQSQAPEITDVYVHQVFAKSSRQALTSGGLEVVTDEGFGGHSVFTHFLLKELRESASPYLMPSDLHNRIKGGVAHNATQTPMLGPLSGAGGEGGEFVLFRGGAASKLYKKIHTHSAAFAELVREKAPNWRISEDKESQSAAPAESEPDQTTGGRPGSLLRNTKIIVGAISALIVIAIFLGSLDTSYKPESEGQGPQVTDEPPPPPPDPKTIELNFWNSIKDSTSQAGFESYLRRYPKGMFAEIARLNIKEMPRAPEPPKKPLCVTFNGKFVCE